MKRLSKTSFHIDNQLIKLWLSEFHQIIGPARITVPVIRQRVSSHIQKSYALENGPYPRSMFFLFDNVQADYLFVSASTSTVFGYTKEEITENGFNWFLTLLSAAELEYKKSLFNDVFGFLKTLSPEMAFKCTVRYDIQAIRKDGNLVHLLEEMMFPEVSSASEPLITSCFLHDLSGYKNGNSRQCKIYLETAGYNEIIFSKNYIVNESEHLPLSQRELEVLEQFAFGLSTRQVAEKLFVTENTIKSHRKNILFKLNAQNTAEAVKLSMKNNWIS